MALETADHNSREVIARLLRRSLERGARVEIDGLGTFLPAKGRTFRFVPQSKPRVFIAYVEEDLHHARQLFDRLSAAGFDPWLDKKRLLAGQNWPRAIETAIQSADFFVACFSRRAVTKRGAFHSELRFALECAARVPLDEIFFIPVRFEECAVPTRITKHLQYVDFFPSWEVGFEQVVKTMRLEDENRKRKQLLLAG